MDNISILGKAWLGFPLAISLKNKGFQIKAAGKSTARAEELSKVNIASYLVDLEKMTKDSPFFLGTDILIINIPYKKVEAFKTLIRIIEKQGISKVLFVSSTSVYAPNKQIITEEMTINDSNLAKIENLFYTNKHFQTTILRFGGLFGYSRNPAKFFSKNHIIKNPNAYVNLIHRDDCIKIIENIITQNAWNECFNACADTHPTRMDFYSKMALEMKKDKPLFSNEIGSAYKIISSEKLKAKLNYSFIHPDLMNLKNWRNRQNGCFF